MINSNEQVFEGNWASACFKTPVDITIPFTPSVAYHYDLPCPLELSPKLGIELAIEQCQRLYDIYNKPLCVLLSGGVDSQAAVQAVVKSGVPYRIVIIQFEKGFNEHDVSYGIELCKRNGWSYDLLNFNSVRFFTTGQYLEFIDPYLNNSPQISLHLKAIEMLKSQGDYLFILGGCPVLHTPEGTLKGVHEFTVMAWNRYAQVTDTPIIGNFHVWSQDLFYRYLVRGDKVLKFNKTPYMQKCVTYLKEGFQIIPQERKYTGFEKLYTYFQSLYPTTPDAFNVFFRHPHQERISVITTAKLHNYDK